MLFNSTEFIFAFLPVTLAAFFLFGAVSRTWALGWLIVASAFFYAWWNPINVLIIAPSLAVNYLLARSIQRLGDSAEKAGLRRLVLIGGILFNVLFLGYFKYLTFVQSSLNDLAGTEFVIVNVVLPLGISFITFQKIAFLIDVHARRVESFTFQQFCLFVLFFPQLIAGPIVHFREMMPQFQNNRARFDAVSLASGLTLFCIGLFKKVVLADGIAGYVSPIYEAAAAGETISLLTAWAAAVGFTLQIYFDFSGYSEMALGIARCFGIKLPVNFDSPLKATSIIDFWLRWHITLTRFLTAYIYNPLALWLTRRRAAKRLPLLGGRKISVGAFVQLLALPTIVTMLISGVWHGAGYLFILWGLLHGVYVVINHAWRLASKRLFSDKVKYARVMRPVGFVLTFTSVAFAMVLFRSTTGAAAEGLLAGMLGFNGLSLPRGLVEPFGLAAALEPFVTLEEGGVTEFVLTNAWIAGLLAIAWLLPNALQVMARFEPALDAAERPGHTKPSAGIFAWRPSLPWAAAVSILAAISVLRLSAESEFLYWQF
jgi:D-alanyl-lipoteichoic acid acyltransferase DltB (MBOAT superfamily)